MAKPDQTKIATTKRAGAKLRRPKSTAVRTEQARVLSSRVSYHGPVFTITTEEVEEPGGVRARRDVVRHSGSIVILAVDNRQSLNQTIGAAIGNPKQQPANLAYYWSGSIVTLHTR